MNVDVKTSAIVNIDIESDEAFKVLCKTLNMEYILNDEYDFYIEKDSHGNNCVCRRMPNGHPKRYDDRGDLFIALRNVAVNMFPNLPFRNNDYIYKK